MRVPIGPVFLVLGSVAITLLALEAVARIIDGVPLLSTENFVARNLDAIHTGGASLYDAETGWVQAPNYNRKLGAFVFTTGAYGVRMPTEQIRPLPEGAVLVVGDSFAVGSEVPNRSSWPAQLEKMIGRPVINAAVGGFAPDQTVLRAEELVPRLRPRVLLMELAAHFSMVTSYSVFSGAPKPYFTIENGALVRQNDPVPRRAASVSDIGWLRGIFGYSYLAYFAMIRTNSLQWWVAGDLQYKREYDNDEALQVTCLLVKRLAALRDQYGIRVGIVVEHGGPFALDPALPWYAKRVDDCAMDQKLELVDAFDALHAIYEKKGLEAYFRLWIMHDNNRAYGHMSDEGNRLIASLVATKFFGAPGAQLGNLDGGAVR